MEAAVQGGREVKRIREDNTLEEKSKGKTKEGASEKLTLGDLNSHRKMFYLIKNTYPYIQVQVIWACGWNMLNHGNHILVIFISITTHFTNVNV